MIFRFKYLLLISVGKKTLDFLKWVPEIIKFEADAVLKIKEFTIVNDCFQYKSNEEIGVFWRALIALSQLVVSGQEVHTELDLTVKWHFKIDSLDQGIKEKWYDQNFSETVMLPGSMVENDKGNPVGYKTEWLGGLRNKNWFEKENYKPYPSKDEFLFPYWLIPDKHYYGAAWYQKIIQIELDYLNISYEKPTAILTLLNRNKDENKQLKPKVLFILSKEFDPDNNWLGSQVCLA